MYCAYVCTNNKAKLAAIYSFMNNLECKQSKKSSAGCANKLKKSHRKRTLHRAQINIITLYCMWFIAH